MYRDEELVVSILPISDAGIENIICRILSAKTKGKTFDLMRLMLNGDPLKYVGALEKISAEIDAIMDSINNII